MNEPGTTAADGRLAYFASLLRETPGAAMYEDVFGRLDPEHPESLADGRRTPRHAAAALLTASARRGPADLSTAVQAYRNRGELLALREIADAETMAAATQEWQRRIEQLVGQAEARAALWDGEGVRCPGGLTWAKKVREVRDRIATAEYPDRPASQKAMIEACLSEMDEGLAAQKERLQARLEQASAELDGDRHSMGDEAYRRAQEYAAAARRELASNNLMIALRKLAALQAAVRGRMLSRPSDERSRRLSVSQRCNPLGRGNFHFEELLMIARKGEAEIDRRSLRGYLPDRPAIEDALQPNGFLQRHSTRRVPEWGSYFAAFREWLGLSESRTSKRGRRLQRLETPNLEPKGANLPGRWAFLAVEPWDGAPFYEDGDGRPRILAIVRLAVADADRGRPQIILQHARQALDELFGTLTAASQPDERRFRDDGLILVLLPGETLSARRYEQLRRQVPLEKPNWSGRIAYLDDLDLLRMVPVRADDRFRALLELALPRFPDALSQTYQNSDAVRSRMFFGRRDELARLKSGTTVVFSGRKMGKSSLLHRLRGECRPDTDQRAIMVGCSDIAIGRSWAVLVKIEKELGKLLRRENLEEDRPADGAGVGTIHDDPSEAMLLAKERFNSFLDQAMHRLGRIRVRQLYVLLDEADNFVRAELEETSGGREQRSAISWYLRDLQTSSYPGRLRFIFAGYDQIGRIFRDPGLGHSAFGNWGEQPLRLAPLDEPAARDLVVQPLTALGMLVGDDMADRILDHTSGHASLIQAFCRKLAERIRGEKGDWPLDDVSVAFEDVQAVANDQRGAGDQNYRELLEQTLGLNLDIAQAYPLKLVFLALVSPGGLGAGSVLGFDGFRFEEALEQVRPRGSDPMEELTPTLVLDSLDLLAQLGLLEDISDKDGRAYNFKARHYVNVLRTKNGFASQLRQAVDDWTRIIRDPAGQAEPRYVWTLPDSYLRSLRQNNPRPGVIVGLLGSGRNYLAEMLAAHFSDGYKPVRLSPDGPEFATQLEESLAPGAARLVIVSDPQDSARWELFKDAISRAESSGIPLRWVGGPRLAWDLAGDLETAVRIDGPFSLGPLGSSELEPWTARPLGGDGAPSGAVVPESERAPILHVTGGLLPVLEQFRQWLMLTYRHFPDPLRLSHAQEFRKSLSEKSVRAERASGLLAAGLPAGFRMGLHRMFEETRDWDISLSRVDMLGISPYLAKQGDEATGRLLDTATWLGLLRVGANAEVVIPHDSIPGDLIRHPGFAAP